MDKIMTSLMSTPSAGVCAHVAGMRSATAPIRTEQGTAVSYAGHLATGNRLAAAGHTTAANTTAGDTAAARTAASHTAEVAFAGTRSLDLPGPVPRGAPV